MKSLSNLRDRDEVLDRLGKVRPDSRALWGTMTAPQMICHLSDSFRGALGEKYISPDTSFFNRVVIKNLALWVPLKWPRGRKTRPEIDQKLGGTTPGEFASDVAALRVLVNRFCAHANKFSPHAFFGQMSKPERNRHAYLHMDHHLRQFGA
ncbi:MAG: DUF1569 domain-containing protein [Candidatus Acidiferrales bacterium]